MTPKEHFFHHDVNSLIQLKQLKGLRIMLILFRIQENGSKTVKLHWLRLYVRGNNRLTEAHFFTVKSWTQKNSYTPNFVYILKKIIIKNNNNKKKHRSRTNLQEKNPIQNLMVVRLQFLTFLCPNDYADSDLHYR